MVSKTNFEIGNLENTNWFLTCVLEIKIICGSILIINLVKSSFEEIQKKGKKMMAGSIQQPRNSKVSIWNFVGKPKITFSLLLWELINKDK